MDSLPMATQPLQPVPHLPLYRLAPLHAAGAAEVAGWARTNGEAFWLAPRTTPPITGEKILNWAAPGRQQLLMCDMASGRNVGYGELNTLNVERAEYWIGHLIVDPQRRGVGIGQALTRLLVQRAVTLYAARRITLVVFPENTSAVRCYEAAGFRHEGYESHYFPVYLRRARLARMAIDA
jgi:ribosomal protein S18 acetylase RimI-like enzyme